jgi:hypothetical protein
MASESTNGVEGLLQVSVASLVRLSGVVEDPSSEQPPAVKAALLNAQVRQSRSIGAKSLRNSFIAWYSAAPTQERASRDRFVGDTKYVSSLATHAGASELAAKYMPVLVEKFDQESEIMEGPSILLNRVSYTYVLRPTLTYSTR